MLVQRARQHLFAEDVLARNEARYIKNCNFAGLCSDVGFKYKIKSQLMYWSDSSSTMTPFAHLNESKSGGSVVNFK